MPLGPVKSDLVFVNLSLVVVAYHTYPGHLVHNGLLRMLPRSDTGGELAYRIRMFAEQAFTGLGPLNFTLQIEFGVPWFVIDYP